MEFLWGNYFVLWWTCLRLSHLECVYEYCVDDTPSCPPPPSLFRPHSTHINTTLWPLWVILQHSVFVTLLCTEQFIIKDLVLFQAYLLREGPCVIIVCPHCSQDSKSSLICRNKRMSRPRRERSGCATSTTCTPFSCSASTALRNPCSCLENWAQVLQHVSHQVW